MSTPVAPTVTEHVNYPHEPGRLYDCGACEASCHCGPGVAAGTEIECVWLGHETGQEPETAPPDGSWFRDEYERAKARNAQIPEHARMIVTNPTLSAHSRGGA